MRLGYACINTTLPTKFKTCRLKTIEIEGVSKIKELSLHNLQQVMEALKWNADHGILFYRLSSELIPFASHCISNSWVWYEDRDILELADKIKSIKKECNMRLSCHPGQFTLLNSIRREVLENSILDLNYHLHLMEIIDGEDIILHVGGAYGDKEASKKRFVEVYQTLDERIKAKLRIENDHNTFNAKDVVDIYEMCGVPICFDIHHHNCNPSHVPLDDLLSSIFSSWGQFKPKVHISSGKTKKTDPSHYDYILENDFINFVNLLGDQKVDMMFEAKMKERAVLRILEWIKANDDLLYNKIEL